MELLYILLLPTWQEEMKAKKEKSIFSDNTSQFCDIGLGEKKKPTSFLLWPGMQHPTDAAIRPLARGYLSHAMDFDTGLPLHTCYSWMTKYIFSVGQVVFYG